MPFDLSRISEASDRYRRERDRYVKLADRVADICREICEANAIRAQVTYRVKSQNSFEGKLRRFARRSDKRLSSVDQIFQDISDLAGVRIATYRAEDCDAVVEAVAHAFSGPQNGTVEIDVKDRNRDNPRNFYRATHVQVCLPEDELVGTYDNLGDVSCEIQVCSMMAHVWNEIEHDIGYKADGSGPNNDEASFLKQLGLMVRMGDEVISQLLNAHAKRLGEGKGEFDDLHDFVARVRDNYAAKDFAKNSGQLYDLLVRLNIASPAALQAKVGAMGQQVAVKVIDVFNAYVQQGNFPCPQMDSDTSDVLLAQLLEGHCGPIIESHRGRIGRGMGAPTRLYRIASRYRAMKETVA